MVDGRAVLHYCADVDHILAVFIDGSPEQADERFVGHDFLGNGIDQKAGVDEGFAGTFAINGAVGQFSKGFSAGRLRADAALNFTHKKKGVAKRGLLQGCRNPYAERAIELGLCFIPVASASNAHGV